MPSPPRRPRRGQQRERARLLRPSREYLFLVMAFVAGGFFGNGVPAISVRVIRDHCRAFPGGTGHVKVAANYAPSFAAQRQAQLSGCEQVLWLDATERAWVEECSGMNVFLVRGRGRDAEVVTPALSGTLLPGVTRDSLLTLAARGGFAVAEERVPIGQLRGELATGRVSEMFVCGTAAVVTPVARILDGDEEWTVGDGTPGPVSRRLRQAQ